jgi:RHS repeat-associated protein
MEYFAFGETFVQEHSNTDRIPYLFNGKELDAETGLYYYGARYYDPRTSIWQSVDPMADEFAGWSPYNYGFDNPLRFMDPTGMAPHDSTVKGEKVRIYDPEQAVIVTAKYKPQNLQNKNTAGKPSGDENHASPSAHPGTSHVQNATWSASNNGKIADLDPRMQQPVIDLINRSQNELGLKLVIASSYRSIEKQQSLYDQGRTKPGDIVTWAKPGYSFHNFRLAIDVYPAKANGEPNWNAIVPPTVVHIADELGIQWGGRFPKGKTDNPHFQMKFGQTISQVRKANGL